MEKLFNYNKEKIKLIFISATFGTIGLVTHFIPLSSAVIVFYRASLGVIFIITMCLVSKTKIDILTMKQNLLILIWTGFFMGLNWVLQFEAFKVSSVAIGTVCYNTMPIFLIIISSFLFNEKINTINIICILCASIGVVLVSNIVYTGIKSNEVLGCFYGILGAIFYALIVAFNKKLNFIKTHDKIIFQFIFSSIIMFFYVLLIEKNSFVLAKTLPNTSFILAIICILLLSFFHTGFCYIHYFNATSKLKAETVAILTYIDPVVALFLSYFVLNEKMSFLQLIGAIIILLSTLINELLNIKNS